MPSDMFRNKPVLGWGLRTFPVVYPQFRSFYTNFFVNEAHNDYLQLLCEMGLLGFGTMVWFLIVLYRAALSQNRGLDVERERRSHPGLYFGHHRNPGPQPARLQSADSRQRRALLRALHHRRRTTAAAALPQAQARIHAMKKNCCPLRKSSS